MVGLFVVVLCLIWLACFVLCPDIPVSAWNTFANHFPKLSKQVATWGWFGLVIASLTVESANEYGLALFLMILAAVCLCLVLFHWEGYKESELVTTSGRILGLLVVFGLLTMGSLFIWGRKGTQPWSKLPSYWASLVHKTPAVSASSENPNTANPTSKPKPEQVSPRRVKPTKPKLVKTPPNFPVVSSSLDHHQAPIQITVNCGSEKLPIQVTVDKPFYVFLIYEWYSRRVSRGLFRNLADEAMNGAFSWPDANLLAQANLNEQWVRRCDFVNHGDDERDNVANFKVPITIFYYHNLSPKGGFNPATANPTSTTNELEIAALDHGKKATVYFVNSCWLTPVITIPSSAKGKLAGESDFRSFTIEMTDENEKTSLQMLPSHVNFGGNQCEESH